MFLDYFKMSAHPFSEPTPVNRILQDKRISQGLARLKYLADQGVIGLLTGQTGIGKSSLIRLFIHSLSGNRHRPLYIHLTHIKASALLRLIVNALGEMPGRGKEKLFLQILERARKSDRTVIMAIDESHLLDSDALVDLRLLASSVMDDAPPLKILLAGQEPLLKQLKMDRHADLVQRISVRYRLFPLTKEQTASYIDYQMKSVDASEKIFNDEAKAVIHDYASGVPRQINNIATACLMNAASQNLKKIDENLVNATMEEFHF